MFFSQSFREIGVDATVFFLAADGKGKYLLFREDRFFARV
jgi:hypothetical protein